ncbi:MAG: LLM class flavin-dependent oxidoreductase [Acidimicrobiia bacterium]
MARQMRVGVQLPEVERPVSWIELRDIARTAEAVGFDSVWFGDHLLYRDDEGNTTGPWEAWSVLAALAEATDRVQLAPLVAATAFHNPAMLAKKAATVDEISAGRLILGLGAGWNKVEFDAYGFPYDRRASRFEEAFTIIRTLLSEGHIDFDGEFYTLRDCELVPPARPAIPLMVGSQGPRVLRATLPYVDSWNAWYAWFGNTPEGARTQMDQVDALCDEVGRPRDDVEKTVAVMVEGPGAMGNAERVKRWDDPPAVSGSPEEIAGQLNAYASIGVAEIQIMADPITAASVEWFGQVLDELDS